MHAQHAPPQARREAEALRDALKERTARQAKRERGWDEQRLAQRQQLEAEAREVEERRRTASLDLHVSNRSGVLLLLPPLLCTRVKSLLWWCRQAGGRTSLLLQCMHGRSRPPIPLPPLQERDAAAALREQRAKDEANKWASERALMQLQARAVLCVLMRFAACLLQQAVQGRCVHAVHSS